MKEENKTAEELKEENALLLTQLENVQKELEKYFYKISEYESERDIYTRAWKNNELFAGLNILDHPLINMFIKFKNLEREAQEKNSLDTRLAAICKESVNSRRNFMVLPLRIKKMLQDSESIEFTDALGGKSFLKVVDVHKQSGPDAVEKFLDKMQATGKLRANAYEALASSIKDEKDIQPLVYARKSWEWEPTTERLIRFACFAYDKKEILQACALLAMLPNDAHLNTEQQEKTALIQEECKRLLESHEGLPNDDESVTNAVLRRENDSLKKDYETLQNNFKDLEMKIQTVEQEKVELNNQISDIFQKMLAELGTDKNFACKFTHILLNSATQNALISRK